VVVGFPTPPVLFVPIALYVESLAFEERYNFAEIDGFADAVSCAVVILIPDSKAARMRAFAVLRLSSITHFFLLIAV
jgi:hypothetical protein